MIKRKKKICRICLTPQFIFSDGRCERCTKKEDFIPIPKISENQKLRIERYQPERESFLQENPFCQINVKCSREDPAPATQVHHMKGKIGELLWDKKHFCAACWACHRWAEDHPEQAYEIGVTKSRLEVDNDEMIIKEFDDFKNFLLCDDGSLMTWEEWYKRPVEGVSLNTEDAEFEIIPPEQKLLENGDE